MIKVLNLYAGLGGNRELWKGCEVTAVESNPAIAAVYQERFPDDVVIVGDAHEYLRQNYSDFDFIWSSPPCPSHSRARFWNTKAERIYPDMDLYQEIIFLKHHFKGKWVVENVVPYYEPLIQGEKIGRHLFWSNFDIKIDYTPNRIKVEVGNLPSFEAECGFSTEGVGKGMDRYRAIRNMVDPVLGGRIFDCAFREQVDWL